MEKIIISNQISKRLNGYVFVDKELENLIHFLYNDCFNLGQEDFQKTNPEKQYPNISPVTIWREFFIMRDFFDEQK